MKTSVNWVKLVMQNRAKAIGVPWSKEDENALKDGISPEDVRAGLLTKEKVVEANKIDEESETPNLERLPIDELNETAKEMGLGIDLDVASRSDIIKEVEEKTDSNDDLLKMTRPELSALAKELEIEFVYIKTTKSDFVELIQKARLK